MARRCGGPVVGVTLENLEYPGVNTRKTKGGARRSSCLAALRRIEAPEFPLPTPWDKTHPLMQSRDLNGPLTLQLTVRPAGHLKNFADEKSCFAARFEKDWTADMDASYRDVGISCSRRGRSSDRPPSGRGRAAPLPRSSPASAPRRSFLAMGLAYGALRCRQSRLLRAAEGQAIVDPRGRWQSRGGGAAFDREPASSGAPRSRSTHHPLAAGEPCSRACSGRDRLTPATWA